MNPEEMSSGAFSGWHEHEIAEAFVADHGDGCIGRDLFDLGLLLFAVSKLNR